MYQAHHGLKSPDVTVSFQQRVCPECMSSLQVITLDHDKYERELNNIPKSHSKSIQARDNMKLRPVRSEAPKSDLKARLPKLYRALEEDAGMLLFALVTAGPIYLAVQQLCL